MASIQKYNTLCLIESMLSDMAQYFNRIAVKVHSKV